MAKRGKLLQLIGICALLSLLLSACGANLADGSAGSARDQVDAALAQARTAGVAAATVTALAQQERHIDSQRGWLGIGDADAAHRYQLLAGQIDLAETKALAVAQTAMTRDLATLTTTTQHNDERGIASPLYQRWQQFNQQQLAIATTPHDFQRLDITIQGDLAIAQVIAQAYDMLDQMRGAQAGLRAAGLPIALMQTEYTQDQSTYATATTAADFQRLDGLMQTELIGLVNDQIQAIPYIGNALLGSFQQRIALAHGFGENVTAFQSTLAGDQRSLHGVTSLTQYMTFHDQVTQQMDALSLPLVRGQARHDLAMLQSLLTYCDQHQITDYEYTSAFGLDGVSSEFLQSLTAQDFQQVDGETTVLIENLRTMIANGRDATPYDQAHAADLDLMRYYNITQGKVLIISTREQTARAYENGQLVMTTYVTTGRPELPSPPGFWHVSQRITATTFYSPYPPDSEFWYAPTFVNYALLYHDGGFYVHDAWWRIEFGPGSNLPHLDPAAFNGGSHGCVNVPLQQMALLFAWTPVGTPVIVY